MAYSKWTPFSAHMLRTFVFLLLLGAAQALFPSFRNDSFADNVLRDYTNVAVDTVSHDIASLSDGSFIITGTVTYPAGMPFYPSFTDEPQVTYYENRTDTQHTAGFLLRAFADGTVEWARRIALCTPETTFSLAVLSDNEDTASNGIFVAGGTTGIPVGFGSSNCCQTLPGRILLHYNVKGAQRKVVVHGYAGERYTAISRDSVEKSLLLTAQTPGLVGVFDNPDVSPSETGLAIARVQAWDLRIKLEKRISDANAVDRNGTLVRDAFWDMALSSDGSRVFVAALRRSVERFAARNMPMIFSLELNTLTVEQQRALPAQLQVDMRLVAAPDSGGVFGSFVDRTGNKERLVVQHLGASLKDEGWGTGSAEASSKATLRIKLDGQSLRQVRSTVRGLAIDEHDALHVLVYSAEVLNETIANAEWHRRLPNGRPATVVFDKRHEVRLIEQAQTAIQWDPAALLVRNGTQVVVGADRGAGQGGRARLLLTGVAIPDRTYATQEAETSPEATASGSPTDTSTPTPDAEDEPACIGISTRLGGVGIRERIAMDDGLRLQRHPRRGAETEVEVLCHEWRNATADVLCATRDHVVRYFGRAVYMREFCERVRCETRVERALNFKGRCGAELAAHDVLSVTMHAGGASARQAVDAECWLMRQRRWWWWLTTL